MLDSKDKTSGDSQKVISAYADTATQPNPNHLSFKALFLNLKSISKKVRLIAGIVIAAVIVLVIALRIYFSPINKFERALESEEISEAQAIFEENYRDGKFAAAVDKKLADYLISVIDSYISDEISYEDAQNAANAIDSMVSVQDALSSLKIISDSKASLKSAEEAEARADYYDAIEKYKQISPEDTKDYAIMEDRIAAAKKSLVSNALEDAASSVQAGDHVAAITTLKEVQKSGYATPEINEALLDTVAGMIQACEKPTDYYEAYNRLKKIELEGIEPLLDQAVSAASAKTVSEADALIAHGKYIDAFNVLSTPKNDFVTPEVESALKNCASLATDAILSDAKALMDDGQYGEAYELLYNTDSRLLTDEINATKKEYEGIYRQAVLDAADQLAGQGDYDGAIEVIKSGQRLLAGQDLADKAEQYRLEKIKSEQLITVEKTQVKDSFLYSQATVVVKNRSDKVVKEYIVAMIMLDSNGYPVNNQYNFDNYLGYKNVHGGRADSANIQPDATYGSNSYWNIEQKCDKILACVVSAEFYDGTTWINPYLEPWLSLYAETPLTDLPA